MKRVFGFLVALVFILSVPAVYGVPSDQIAELGEMGPYQVGFYEYLLVDGSRNQDSSFGGRPIPVAVWYPVDPADVSGAPEALYAFDPYASPVTLLPAHLFESVGIDPAYQEVPISRDAPFPLVVFSPGLGASYLFHISVGTRLASHGFAVAVVTHYGDGATPSDALQHLSMSALNRTVDIPFVLDDLEIRNEDPSDPLSNLFLPDKIAGAGWSLGGYGMMALTGGDDEVCDLLNFPYQSIPPTNESCVPAVPDERIKAIITLEGSNQVLHFDEMARITVPALAMGRDWATLAVTQSPGPDWQARQHAAIQGHPSYRVDVNNSHHITFSDRCVVHPILRDLGLMDPGFVEFFNQSFCAPFIPYSVANPIIKRYMLAFLKTQLAGEAGYQNMLTPGWAIKNEPNIQFFVTEKKNPNAIDQDWPDISIYFQGQPGH